MFDLVQWQKLDKDGICFPWFTHPFLDVLDTWHLEDKVVLEYGGGKSTIWWASRCKEVFTIETSEEWLVDIANKRDELGLKNITLYLRTVNEGDQSQSDYYTRVPTNCEPDIVVIDGILRHNCLEKALTLPKPITIIHDNWQQDGFVCPSSVELMKPYETHNFIQENHTDNHGNKWATAYWKINK